MCAWAWDLARAAFAPTAPPAFCTNWARRRTSRPARQPRPVKTRHLGCGLHAIAGTCRPRTRVSQPDARPSPNRPICSYATFSRNAGKGLTPILWARQLKQERLDELIYLSLMNVDHLPVDDLVSPMSDFYRFDTTPGGRKPEDDSDQSDSAANKGGNGCLIS